MICDFDSDDNDDLHVCNIRTGIWIPLDSEQGRDIISYIDNTQPDIIDTIINGKARTLRRLGHNNYSLITNHQPDKLYDIDDDKLNKKYCGNNSNIYDMINYLNNYNAIAQNPYKYKNVDNLYNCLKKGIYIGKQT